MALQSEKEELLAAWRALAGNSSTDGWRTIPVATGGPCLLLAGRRFPGNEEALLVGFATIRIPATELLPQGRGFLVLTAEVDADRDSNRTWIALCRQSAGSLDLFASMTVDIVSTLKKTAGTDDAAIFQTFLARISAWQEFMRRGGDLLLGPEAEIGLFGELEVLRDLILAGLPPGLAVESWKGPLDAVHDFRLGTGAIEVKTTLSSSGFPAMIGSLEQLDDALAQPLYLAGIRLALNLEAPGKTLSEQIADIRDLMRADPAALGVFESRILCAGVLEAYSDRYTRRFSPLHGRVLLVSNHFPRLIRTNVALEIKRVDYVIDLDCVDTEDVTFDQALEQLGVMKQWN